MDQLSLSLGTLRLRTPKDVRDATALLREIDFKKLVTLSAQEARELRAEGQSVTVSERVGGQVSSEVLPTPDSEEHSLQLKVSLRGLDVSSRSPNSLVTGLQGRIEGNAKALNHLRKQIKSLFAGHMSKRTMPKSISNIIDFSLMSTHLLHTKTVTSKSKNRTVKFNARLLCDRYKDIVLAKSVRLEQICISQIGLRDYYDKGQCVARAVYRDIASVALPGFPAPPPLNQWYNKSSYSPAMLATPPPTKTEEQG